MTERQLRFIRHYTAGGDGIVGNAKASYIAAGYSARGHVAESAGARMVRKVEIAAAIGALRGEAQAQAVAQLVPWFELAGLAQDVMLRIMRGELTGRDAGTRLQAANVILDRALGKPVASTHVQIAGRSIDDELDELDRITVRFVSSDGNGRPLLESGESLDDM